MAQLTEVQRRNVADELLLFDDPRDDAVNAHLVVNYVPGGAMKSAGAKHIDISGMDFEEGGAAQTADIRTRAADVAVVLRNFGREEDAVLMDNVIDSETRDIERQANWVSGVNACRLAAKQGQVESVRAYLMNDMDPRLPNEWNMTLLHLAASNGQKKVVELLIEDYGVDPNEQCLKFESGLDETSRVPGGGTALTMAVRGNHEPTVMYLLTHTKSTYTDLDATQDGQTSLMLAAKRGHCQIVRQLLSSGANASIVACGGNGVEVKKTAREIAAYYGKNSVEMVFNHWDIKQGQADVTQEAQNTGHAQGIKM